MTAKVFEKRCADLTDSKSRCVGVLGSSWLKMGGVRLGLREAAQGGKRLSRAHIVEVDEHPLSRIAFTLIQDTFVDQSPVLDRPLTSDGERSIAI